MAPLAQALSLRTMTVFGASRAAADRRSARRGRRAGGCPGRLADHVQAGHAHLDAVEISVLDEADHMADLGFLPTVRRLLELTPRGGQRLLFSATLDSGVDVLVRRFLTDPVVHSVDSPRSPVAAMTHHVLHVQAEDRFAVLVDLTAAPGRTVVFTRTKRGAKTLTRRLVAAGVAAVELHGNLAQGARTRNLKAFSDGTVRTLVATDIAARGIHVDDVALVVHADPPVEHKAYLHRSGRTARAGAAGTVVTLMTDTQAPEVRELTRKAGIAATTTRLRPGDALLRELAPGERTLAVAPRRAPERHPTPDDLDDPPERPPAMPAGVSCAVRIPRTTMPHSSRYWWWENLMKVTKDLVAASATPMVLGILADGESYGYAILRRINELSDGELDWTEGLLYPLLHRLERLGHVESSWQSVPGERRRKYYRITDSGLAELAEQRRQWDTVVSALKAIWVDPGDVRRLATIPLGGLA